MNSIFCRPSDGRWSCRFGTPGCAFDHGPLLPLAGSGTTSPLPIVIHCPDCGKQHVDEGEWATEPHKTHLCSRCKHLFRPMNVPTVGVLRLTSTK